MWLFRIQIFRLVYICSYDPIFLVTCDDVIHLFIMLEIYRRLLNILLNEDVASFVEVSFIRSKEIRKFLKPLENVKIFRPQMS